MVARRNTYIALTDGYSFDNREINSYEFQYKENYSSSRRPDSTDSFDSPPLSLSFY